MAEVSFLHLPEFDHDLFLAEISAVDSFSFWPHDHLAGPTCGFDFADDFGVENGVVSSPDRKNQVNFVMDLLNQRVEESNLVGTHEIASIRSNELNFGVIEENIDVGVHHSEVELGLGLGFDDQEHDEDDCNCGGFVVSDCGGDFYIAKRRENEIRVFDEGSSSSGVSELKSVWIESDSDDEDVRIDTLLTGIVVNNDVKEEEDIGVENVNGDDLSVPLCWDSMRIEDNIEDEHVEVNRDFEWEEVEGEGPISVLNFRSPEEEAVEEEFEDHQGIPFSLDWEVLMSVNTMASSNVEVEGQDDDFIYEMMFGQFENAAGLGRPPASKTVVEHLLSVVLRKEDEMSVCAVCKERMDVGEECKELPCSHRYHGNCIVPWLEIRNTCPVCRFELATDDPDYEQRRARMSSRAV